MTDGPNSLLEAHSSSNDQDQSLPFDIVAICLKFDSLFSSGFVLVDFEFLKSFLVLSIEYRIILINFSY